VLVLPLASIPAPRPGLPTASPGMREAAITPATASAAAPALDQAALSDVATPAPADSPPGGAADTVAPHAAPTPPVGLGLPRSGSLAHAIQAGTRTQTGVPGPRYWQQRADYRIEAEVDFSVPELRGRETITYHNNSPNALDTLGLRLQQNVMKGSSPRTYAMPVTDGMTVGRLTVGGVEISLDDPERVQPEGGAFVGVVGVSQVKDVGTLVWVILPEPIPSGGTTEIQVDWSFRIPPESAPRMGMQDSTTVQMAQWYPQVAVYDDLNGWDHQLYLGTGEFYYEYGDFDLTLRVPPGFVVAATGTLQNAAEVLTPEGVERLERAAKEPEPVRILSAAEFGPGRVLAPSPGSSPPPSPCSSSTPGSCSSSAPSVAWRFRAEDVRDFAFAASDHYQWDATHALVDSAAGRTAMVHAVWRPDRTHADTAVRMAAHAVAFHSAHIAPYLYPQITLSEGGSGGMEYPMIVFVEAYAQGPTRPDPEVDMYALIAHEIGHEWFPMMVGSNETAYGWQDEGVNTFRTVFASEDHDGPSSDSRQETRDSYLPVAGSDFEQPLMTHSDAFPITGEWYDVAAYEKPAQVLFVLRDVLGPELFDRTLSEYTRTWTLKHPTPQDFFDTFEQAAGEDLDWFWRPWFYETEVLDLAVAGVDAAPDGGHTIRVVNRGQAPAPVVALVQLADGGTRRLTATALDLAGDGAVALTLPPGAEPVAIQLDPDHAYPDADPSNDAWPAAADASPSTGR
jgi:hypothetical protein